MATVVNNPSDTGSNGLGLVLGVILVLAVLFLFFVYGLPRLTGGAGSGTGAQVNLPSTVNVQSK
jgi:hypothetical protein